MRGGRPQRSEDGADARLLLHTSGSLRTRPATAGLGAVSQRRKPHQRKALRKPRFRRDGCVEDGSPDFDQGRNLFPQNHKCPTGFVTFRQCQCLRRCHLSRAWLPRQFREARKAQPSNHALGCLGATIRAGEIVSQLGHAIGSVSAPKSAPIASTRSLFRRDMLTNDSSGTAPGYLHWHCSPLRIPCDS
jgi:hypothetical protein